MTRPIRFGMMGAGFIARPNASALLAHPQARLVALSNRTEAKARQVAHDLGIDCAIYQDWREMIEQEDLDAVLINLSHQLHRDAFIACAERGLDIIIEKALANTYQECQEMMDAAERHAIKATVCHTQRYHAVFQEAAAFIEKNDLGRLLGISDHIHTHYFWDGRSDWQLSNEASGGGIALNYGVHQLDRVHFFLKQKTVQLSAQYLCEKPGYEIPSSYAMMGVGDQGTPYTITCSGYSGPHTDECRLLFEGGMIHCCVKGGGLYPEGLYVGTTQSGAFEKQPVVLDPTKNYERQFFEAVSYLVGDRPDPPVPLSWAAEMVRLVKETLP